MGGGKGKAFKERMREMSYSSMGSLEKSTESFNNPVNYSFSRMQGPWLASELL